MTTVNTERRINRVMNFFIIVAVICIVVFYDGFSRETWPMILGFGVLQIYLHGISVRLGERNYMSLGSSALIPMVYFLNVTPTMIISVILGISDGLRHSKHWRRTLFNSGQLALSALITSKALKYLLIVLGTSKLNLLIAVILATIIYLVCNIGLVSCIGALWRNVPWWEQFKLSIKLGRFSNISNGLTGIIFTFFVVSYGFWGMVAFGALLINLSGLLKAAAEISAERALRKELEEELVIDEMTGAYNFRYLNDWLSEPSEDAISLLFMDIDDFAVFNNTYGHAEGDKVLRKLVETISESVRSDDEVIRYGGDEFVVFLKNMDETSARRVAERIMEKLAVLHEGNWEIPVTVSLGIASKPHHTGDKRQLLLFADQAMYEAKDAGKNQIQMWTATENPA